MRKKKNFPVEVMERRIFSIREQRVMLDIDLAIVYSVSTGALNQAVKRNLKRFPIDFMFRLTPREWENLKSQFVISSWGGRRVPPIAFTEHGAVMLASVLKSSVAVKTSVNVVRAFVNLRKMIGSQKELSKQIEKLSTRIDQNDAAIQAIIETIRRMIEEPAVPRTRVGFTLPTEEKEVTTKAGSAGKKILQHRQLRAPAIKNKKSKN